MILHLCVLYLFTSHPHTLIELLLFGCDVIGSIGLWILGRSLAGQLTCLFSKVKLHGICPAEAFTFDTTCSFILFACINIVVDLEFAAVDDLRRGTAAELVLVGRCSLLFPQVKLVYVLRSKTQPQSTTPTHIFSNFITTNVTRCLRKSNRTPRRRRR